MMSGGHKGQNGHWRLAHSFKEAEGSRRFTGRATLVPRNHFVLVCKAWSDFQWES